MKLLITVQDVLTFVEATSKKGSITCGQCFFNDTCDATYACKGYDRKDGTDGYFHKWLNKR